MAMWQRFSVDSPEAVRRGDLNKWESNAKESWKGIRMSLSAADPHWSSPGDSMGRKADSIALGKAASSCRGPFMTDASHGQIGSSAVRTEIDFRGAVVNDGLT
jgi:hypothetical protein